MIRMQKIAYARCTLMQFFGSGLDPDSNGIADPDWGSGSRQAKITLPNNLIVEVFSVGQEASSGPKCPLY
jgi:hypothetical protein